MKILIIDNSAMSKKGESFFTNSLNGLFIKELINCGNSISYYQFSSGNSKTINSFNLIENGVKCYPQKTYKNKVFSYFFAYFNLLFMIMKNDFVYFYFPNAFKYGILFCTFLGKSYGLYVRGMKGVNSRISKKIYKKAFVVFTVSDLFTNYINSIIQTQKAHTIKPMILFSEKDIIMDRNYPLSGKVSILYLGRIAHDKGIAELLKAIQILKEKKYDFELNLVGNGEFLQKSKQLIEEYDISESVKVHGAVLEADVVKSFYINSDLYILPTYHEGFPRTLYEAMIFGTPIITTFVGGIPALMKDGWNCKEIQPKSTESIVEALEFAFLNYDKMKDYAKNGTNTVYKIVDSKRMSHAQHLNEIIKTL